MLLSHSVAGLCGREGTSEYGGAHLGSSQCLKAKGSGEEKVEELSADPDRHQLLGVALGKKYTLSNGELTCL